MLKRFLIFFIPVFIFLIFQSCDEDNTLQKRMENERNERLAYVEEHNIPGSAKKDEGIYYVELKAGDGDTPKSGDWMVVYYTGYFLDGYIFDSNELSGKYEPLIVELIFNEASNYATGYFIQNGNRGSSVMQGWAHALKYMKKGTRARVIIPSILAYGIYGSGAVPGYSTLVFEMEVTEIRGQ